MLHRVTLFPPNAMRRHAMQRLMIRWMPYWLRLTASMALVCALMAVTTWLDEPMPRLALPTHIISGDPARPRSREPGSQPLHPPGPWPVDGAHAGGHSSMLPVLP